MAKKKGGKKKKGSSKSKEKKEKETVAPLYNFPQYEDPKDVTPLVKVVICLAEPATSLMRIEDQYYVNTKVGELVDQIKQLHQGSINNIKISKQKGDFSECLDVNKTLEECGIFGNDEFNLFYDFKAICHPLLT